MKTYPSRTDENANEPRGFEQKTSPAVRRFGLVIPEHREPVAAHDETMLSCTAYGLRTDPKRDENPGERKILSSCESDDRRI
jgi:hypothetical protein